jgi:hypothetical protein
LGGKRELGRRWEVVRLTAGRRGILIESVMADGGIR